MSLPRLLAICGALLFGVIFVLAFFKEEKKEALPPAAVKTAVKVVTKTPTEVPLTLESPLPPRPAPPSTVAKAPPASAKSKEPLVSSTVDSKRAMMPDEDRVEELFKKGGSPFKFIETITYKSRVPWQKGRPAWLSDYASYYETSRHFIARSLNGKSDYFKQDINEGDRFNAFKKEVKLKFYLLVDASVCKMGLYALDETHNEVTLIKTYSVCLGRPDSGKISGLLTPLGRYSLGSRIAIYKPKVMSYHNGKKIEMVRVFGSRWIPFDKEIADASAPAKGFGIHGVPWTETGKGELSQDKSSLGKYESDGCIRLSTEDMEELFAIIITKPAEIEIVRHFNEASLNKK